MALELAVVRVLALHAKVQGLLVPQCQHVGTVRVLAEVSLCTPAHRNTRQVSQECIAEEDPESAVLARLRIHQRDARVIRDVHAIAECAGLQALLVEAALADALDARLRRAVKDDDRSVLLRALAEVLRPEGIEELFRAAVEGYSLHLESCGIFDVLDQMAIVLMRQVSPPLSSAAWAKSQL